MYVFALTVQAWREDFIKCGSNDYIGVKEVAGQGQEDLVTPVTVFGANSQVRGFYMSPSMSPRPHQIDLNSPPRMPSLGEDSGSRQPTSVPTEIHGVVDTPGEVDVKRYKVELEKAKISPENTDESARSSRKALAVCFLGMGLILLPYVLCVHVVMHGVPGSEVFFCGEVLVPSSFDSALLGANKTRCRSP